LIELIVVVAIIAVLMALVSAGVMKVMHKGPELQTRSEIEQMQAGVSEAQQKHGVDYIPSQIVLRENMTTYVLTDKLERESLTFLNKMFPGCKDSTSINWNGDGVVNGGRRWVLTGDQCLVFFLGGIPNQATAPTPDCLGFSQNNKNPAQTTGSRSGPYFKFQPGRLVRDPNNFLHYNDPYNKQRYAYFSGYGNETYNRYPTNDCGSLGVSPYQASFTLAKTTYQNPKSFQIISAGQDGAFGPGGTVWGPSNPASGPGADDMSNFHERKLGAP